MTQGEYTAEEITRHGRERSTTGTYAGRWSTSSKVRSSLWTSRSATTLPVTPASKHSTAPGRETPMGRSTCSVSDGELLTVSAPGVPPPHSPRIYACED